MKRRVGAGDRQLSPVEERDPATGKRQGHHECICLCIKKFTVDSQSLSRRDSPGKQRGAGFLWGPELSPMAGVGGDVDGAGRARELGSGMGVLVSVQGVYLRVDAQIAGTSHLYCLEWDLLLLGIDAPRGGGESGLTKLA